MLPTMLTATLGFLAAGRFVHRPHATFVSHHAAAAASFPASRSSVYSAARAPPPLAFEGGFHPGSLTNEELETVARARGIVVAPDTERDELLALLDMSPDPAAPSLALNPAEAARVDAFERVAPAVAYIQVSVEGGSPFQMRPNSIPVGSGSGFVWDAEGHIVTNYHVVNGGPQGRPGRGMSDKLPRKVRVKLQGMGRDEMIEATVVGYEADKDIAVLKIDPAALGSGAVLTPLEAASSAALKVGQSVLAIGNPFGLDWTLTQGIVSALGRDIDGAGGRPIRDCVQTDAAINPGNSGGPLLDSAGRLIGVNTMIFSPGGLGASVGIGFAVPVDTVKRVVTQIIERGQNARPSLGVSLLPDQLRTQYGRFLKRKLEGAVVAEVLPGSPAEQLDLTPCERRGAGVRIGDMITSCNGVSVSKNEDLLCAVEESEPDQPLTLTVMKACDPNRIVEVEVTPVARKELRTSA